MLFLFVKQLNQMLRWNCYKEGLHSSGWRGNGGVDPAPQLPSGTQGTHSEHQHAIRHWKEVAKWSLKIFIPPTFYVSYHPKQFSLELLSGATWACPTSRELEQRGCCGLGHWFLSGFGIWVCSFLQVTSLPVPQVLWENSHSLFGCLLSSLLSEEMSASTKEMRMSLWILAHLM